MFQYSLSDHQLSRKRVAGDHTLIRALEAEIEGSRLRGEPSKLGEQRLFDLELKLRVHKLDTDLIAAFIKLQQQ